MKAHWVNLLALVFCRQRPADQGLQSGVLPQHGEPHGCILPPALSPDAEGQIRGSERQYYVNSPQSKAKKAPSWGQENAVRLAPEA